MFPAQSQGSVAQRVDSGMRPFATPVTWAEGGFAMRTILSDQMSDGANRQAEGQGDSRRRLATLMASHDRLTQRIRDGSWHWKFLTWGKTNNYKHPAYRPNGKT